MADAVIYEDAHLSVALTYCPVTPSHCIINLSHPLFEKPVDFQNILLFARNISRALCAATSAKRCALAYDGSTTLHLLPLHGLKSGWAPVTQANQEYHETFSGYLTTKNGPQWTDSQLDAICSTIKAVSKLRQPTNNTFLGAELDQNLFSRIVRGELPQWRVWEDDRHVAFLTPFPSSPGYTVLVPRSHLSSDIFSLEKDNFTALMEAARMVAGLLTKALDLTRCGLFFEGFEIDYAHVKIVPVHDRDAASAEAPTGKFYEFYDGSITTQFGPLTEDKGSLNTMAGKIRDFLRR